MSDSAIALPPGVLVFERGWLSSNNVLLVGDGSCALVDTGYFTHAEQTVALVDGALKGRLLDLLVNTHLHSDHCGGNAAMQARYPSVRTLIPPGQADAVRNWNPVELSYVPTGQYCPRFGFDGVLVPGSTVRLGHRAWEVHGAPGHDPDSVVLFEPVDGVLISADALWENGFGVVFPELEGERGFEDVGATLDLIESLAPRTVIPGHGAVFQDVATALANARRRLDGFLRDPVRHARHGVKVLLKFKLLELQEVALPDFEAWVQATPYMEVVRARYFADQEFTSWVRKLLQELVDASVARLDHGLLRNI